MELEKKYICSKCGRLFKRQEDLDRHCKATGHNVEKDIDCPFCNKKFKSQKDLKQHQKTKHPQDIDKSNAVPIKAEKVSSKNLEKGKMNESEARFKEWLDHQVYNFYYLDQTSPTQPEQFKNIVTRPDFFIKLTENKHIYVDVKEKQLYTDTESFTLYKETIERLLAFEEELNAPV